jgi:hypothetical protein
MPDRRRFALRLGGVATLCLAVAVVLRIPALDQPLDRDTAAYAAIGRLLGIHELPYRDLFDHKQPLIHWVYAVVDWIAPGSLAAIRVAAAVPSALAAALLYVVLERIAGPGRAALAALLAVLLSASTMIQGTDLNTEHLLVLPATATVLGALALERTRWAGVPLAIGVLGGLAVLAKAIGGLIALAALIPLLAGRDARGQTVLGTLARFGAGLALPAAVVVIGYAAAGAADDLVFANLTYNGRYVAEDGLSLVPRGPGPIGALAAAAVCCALVRLVSLRGRDVAGWTLLAWLAGAWLGAQTSSRGFPHYYVPLLVPAVALLVLPAVRAERPLVLVMGGARLLAAGAAVLIALPVLEDARLTGDEIAVEIYGEQTVALGRPADAVGPLLRRRSGAEDELFVVGAEPAYYWRSGLTPYRRWLYDYPLEFAPERFLPDVAGLCRDGPRFVVLAAPELPSYARRCADGGYAELLRDGSVVVLERR